MTVEELFGIGSFIDNDNIVIPRANIDALEVDSSNLNGDRLLAALVLLTYDTFFKNNAANPVLQLEKTITAPILVDTVEKIEFGWTFKFLKDYTTPLFDPDEV